MSHHILIIDEDFVEAEKLKDSLSILGMFCTILKSGPNIVDHVLDEQPDLVILYASLSDGNSKQIYNDIRVESSVPILVQANRGRSVDAALLAELGTNDHLVINLIPAKIAQKVEEIFANIRFETQAPNLKSVANMMAKAIRLHRKAG